jgi:hypothetical protein
MEGEWCGHAVRGRGHDSVRLKSRRVGDEDEPGDEVGRATAVGGGARSRR